MAATDDDSQHVEGRLLRRQCVAGQGSAREKVSIDMPLDVVNGIERLIVGDGQGARRQDADQQAATQASTVGDGNAVEIVPVATGLVERLLDDWQNYLDMATGGDFRYHAAVSRVQIHTAGYYVAEQSMAIFDDRRCRFIATAFYAQNLHYLQCSKFYGVCYLTTMQTIDKT